VIELKHIAKRYHHKADVDNPWVLTDVNITIPTGVSVGLIGPNGAGKSTLLRIIAGMDVPDKGSVVSDSRISWPIGLSGGFQPNMTGRQNVKFVARVYGDESTIESVVDYVRDFAEIGEAFDRPVRTYSAGQRARLLFGMSLAIDFDVYLSDEATSVGDVSFRQKATKAFKERIGRSSLIIVSHGEGILKELCQAGILIHNQKAYWHDDINDALSAYHQVAGAA